MHGRVGIGLGRSPAPVFRGVLWSVGSSRAGVALQRTGVSDGVVSSPGRVAEDSTPLSGHDGGLVSNPLLRSAASVGSPFPDDTAVAVDGLAAIGQDET